MRLRILSTGSIGNCYILKDSKGAQLVLDCGIPYRKILPGLDYDIRTVMGVCVTHEHRDHSYAAKEFQTVGVPVFQPYLSDNSFPKVEFDAFHVQHFPLEHDVPCCGFLITHPEMGKMVYITDTAYCKYRFKDLNHILIECNYDDRYLDGEYAAKGHVLHDHLELQTCKRFLEANRSPQLRNVILCHMSDTNLNRKVMWDEIRGMLPEETELYMAKPKLEVRCTKE